MAFLKVLEGLTPRQLHAARDAARGTAWVAAGETARGTAWVAAGETAWDAAWETGRDAVRDAVRDAAWDAAWDAACYGSGSAAWDAVRAAVLAYVVLDLIPEEQFEVLVQPFREAGVALP